MVIHNYEKLKTIIEIVSSVHFWGEGWGSDSLK